jgi:hypothetical protein
MNPRPEWVVTVRMMGTSIDLLASLKRQVPACSIRVPNLAFERICWIVRKVRACKSFVVNHQQWCESHPLRHPSLASGELRLARRATDPRRMATGGRAEAGSEGGPTLSANT